jgi:hypothetical protein
MLKITFNETPVEESWILYGRLAAPSVRELRTTWKKNHRNDTRLKQKFSNSIEGKNDEANIYRLS